MGITRSLILASALAPRVAFAQPAADEPPPPPGHTESPPIAEVTLAGYVETYYQLNIRAPSNHITNLRGFDNRDRSFTLSNVALGATATRGPLTARVMLQIGSTPSTYYLAEPALPGAGGANATSGELWKYVQQATLAYAAGPVIVDAGLFLSPIGPEAIAVKDDWNWSRSNLFFGLPFYHTGARVAYQLGGGWTGMVHVYNGWNSVVDNNPYPSAAVSATYTSQRVAGQLAYLGGIERATGAPEGQPWRHLVDAYATIAATEDVSVLVQVDAGVEPNAIGTSSWLAGAVSAKLQLTPKLYAAARGDYFREHVAADGATTAAPIFGPTAWLASATATLALQPVDGLSVRLEARHDHAKDRVFFGGDVIGDGVTTPYVPNRRAQDTVTVGAVAWF
ncbi:MAG TPA: outer membrane beta-barrel protein [Kofleriaceae bacterium]|nr:outer membrane beta-barrel protein [Kofleriaceae bacterium]